MEKVVFNYYPHKQLYTFAIITFPLPSPPLLSSKYLYTIIDIYILPVKLAGVLETMNQKELIEYKAKLVEAVKETEEFIQAQDDDSYCEFYLVETEDHDYVICTFDNNFKTVVTYDVVPSMGKLDLYEISRIKSLIEKAKKEGELLLRMEDGEVSSFGDKLMMRTGETIDLEPRWEDIILAIAQNYSNKDLSAEDHEIYKNELLKVAKVADMVRQAQKQGKPSINI